MPLMLRAVCFTTLTLLCASAGAAAADTPEPNPSVYLQAFDETCRAGFPDGDAIAKAAIAHGWIERGVPSVAMIGTTRIIQPHMFSKGGLMLFVTQGGIDAFSTVCQVTGAAATRLTGRDVAAVVGPRLNAGSPEPGPGAYKKDDLAVWNLGGGITVQAGINVYQGRMRTISIAMRQAAPVGAAPIDAPRVKPSTDISMVAIGLPFAPEAPTPVGAAHPLFHDVAIGEIAGLPTTVKSSSLNFIAAAKRSSINAALSETFREMNLLAPVPAAARKRLTVTWLGDQTPFHIGAHNATSVTLHYRLERVDTGRTLFDREITTSASGGGVDAAMRDNGIVRAAIGANFASAANCLDRAAFGTAPADCALTPQYSVSVVRNRR